MKIIKLIKRDKLNEFVSRQKYSQFLQSWEWGEFQRKVSGKIWRLGIEEDNKLVGVATLIKKTLPMGKSYFYCPRGPVFGIKKDELRMMNLLFNEIKIVAKTEGAMFLRFEPLKKIQNSKFKIQNSLDVQPSKTLILNLSKTEDEILKNMHQKTRYNIKLAEKKGVEVFEAGIEKFDDFWQLMAETSGRDNFRLHGIDYYKKMLEIDSNFIKLFFAKYKNKIIGISLVSFFGDTATYMHGASASESRNVMAPYLLQWQVIKLAKSKGQKYYDFFGIDEKKWPGVTRFKKGFGGQEFKYPGTFDLVLSSSWYNIYKMVRKTRRTF